MTTPKDSRLDQSRLDDHGMSVEPGQFSPQATASPAPIPVAPAGNQAPPSAMLSATPTGLPPVVDPLLFVHVTAHHDIEQLRIASQHRLRILTATEPDEDGVIRGFALTDDHPDVARLSGLTDALMTLEHQAELNLRRALRQCAIAPWIKAQKGLGDKQVARLLGAIGDPYWNLTDDRPRTVSQLWAYCGLHVLPADPGFADTHSDRVGRANLPADLGRHDAQTATVDGNQASDPGPSVSEAQDCAAGVAAKRRKGQQANWSTDAKTRAYLIATSCIKQTSSPYRAVYDQRRERTAVTHPEWTAGHSHNDGLRILAKAVLKDLWREARRLHGVTDEVAA